jgi:hypothetical protein
VVVRASDVLNPVSKPDTDALLTVQSLQQVLKPSVQRLNLPRDELGKEEAG